MSRSEPSRLLIIAMLPVAAAALLSACATPRGAAPSSVALASSTTTLADSVGRPSTATPDAGPAYRHHDRGSYQEKVRKYTKRKTSPAEAAVAIGVKAVAMPSETLKGRLTDILTNEDNIVEGNRVDPQMRVAFLFYDNGLIVQEQADGSAFSTDEGYIEWLFGNDVEREASKSLFVDGHAAVGWDSGTFTKRDAGGNKVGSFTQSGARINWRQNDLTISVTMPGKSVADILPAAESVAKALGK